MIAAMRTIWTGLSERERKLLIVAGGLAVVVLLWLLLRPMMALGGDLRAQHQAAVERQGRVAAKLAMLKTPVAAGAASAGAVSGSAVSGSAVSANGGAAEQYLAQSAGEIGLSLSRNEARGSGVHIAIAGGKAQTVMAWLADVEGKGFAFDALMITPLADGTVGLSADVRAVTP